MSFIESRFVYGDVPYISEEFMDEKWNYIKGFPEYMVSDKGRVWSIKHRRFLKIKPMDSHSHLGVCLYSDGMRYYRYIHRLVAESFIPNPNNLPVVRHLDDDPDMNTSDNLSWGTQKDNVHDSIRNGRAYIFTNEDRREGNKDRMMKILSVNIKNGIETIFESQGEAARILGIPQANIWKVIRGERQSAGGYYFKEVV